MITAVIEFEGLLERLQTIEELLKKVQPNTIDKWVSNEEFCLLLNICSKTAQSYRDKGLIKFSQIGNKIHYRMSEINNFLDNHSKGGFNNRRKFSI